MEDMYEEKRYNHDGGLNELQFFGHLMKATPEEVEKCMEKLEWVVKGLEEVYSTAEKQGFNPFMEHSCNP